MQQVVMQQPVPITGPIQTDQTRTRRKNFPRRALSGLAISQIVIGILSIVFGVVAIAIECNGSYIGTGIWCGVYFIVSGSLGHVTSRKATKPWIITSMILSIIAAALSGLVYMIISILIIVYEPTYIYDFSLCNYNGYEYNDCWTRNDTRKAIDGVLLTLSVVEAILAIVYASLCCRPLCSGKQQVPAMYYVAAPPCSVAQQVPLMTGVPQTTTAPPVYMMPMGMQVIAQPGGGQQFQTVAYPQQFTYTQQQQAGAVQPQHQQDPPIYQA